jgi:hypothetical protein
VVVEELGGGDIMASLLRRLLRRCTGLYTVSTFTDMETTVTSSKQAGVKAGGQRGPFFCSLDLGACLKQRDWP